MVEPVRMASERRPVVLDAMTAARRLGLSPDALRKRIERGTIDGYKEHGRWWVRLLEEDTATEAETQASHASASAEVETLSRELAHANELLTEVRQQRDTYAEQFARLENELEARRREVSELHVLLQRALEQRPALTLSAPEQPQEEHAKPVRPHWWQRLFTGP
jgi:septal ring factor EnvC (AmiA/AmiB activator)